MTPKEKALSLCQGFGLLGLEEEQTGFYTLNLDFAKKCAIICVEDILKSHRKDYTENESRTYYHPYDYWMEVKKEIELV